MSTTQYQQDDSRPVDSGKESAGGPSKDAEPKVAWILNSWADLVLFVATPLLIVPIILGLRARYAVEDIYLFVAAFGATGHHLPGMLRAYGDKALFRRFRVRFILAPIFLVIICFGFAYRDIEGLTVLLLLWGFWHGMMQVYGFLRIYDAKVKSVAISTSKIDWFMCLAWFGLALLISPGRMEQIFREAYQVGLPLVPPAWFHTFQFAWAVGTLLITVLFVFNYLSKRAAGQPANPIKLLAMGISFGFWWFCVVTIKHTLLGIALFEIFHDVQYLAIVWIFNRKRADSDQEAGTFTRFFFRRSLIMVGVYLAMIFGYGYVVGFLPRQVIPSETFIVSIYGMVAASTFLHFYFDGFIWKVREVGTRKSLGLSEDQGIRERLGNFKGEAIHLVKWVGFLIPAALIFFGESKIDKLGSEISMKRYENMVELVPNSWRAWDDLAAAAQATGDYTTAIDGFKMALEIKTDLVPTRISLGETYRLDEQFDKAKEELEYVVEIAPKNPKSAKAYSELGQLYFKDAMTILARARSSNSQTELEQAQDRFDESLAVLKKSTELDPSNPGLRFNLGEAYRQHANAGANDLYNPQLDIEETKLAIALFDEALEIQPDHVGSLRSRGLAWRTLGESEKAIVDLKSALEKDESQAMLSVIIGKLYLEEENWDEALQSFEVATKDKEIAVEAYQSIAMMYMNGPSGVRDLAKAEEAAIQACQVTDFKDLQALRLVSDIRRQQGNVAGMLEVMRVALQVVPPQARPQMQAEIRRLEEVIQAEIEKNASENGVPLPRVNLPGGNNTNAGGQ